jgi:ketosteroid isomerase-like protein
MSQENVDLALRVYEAVNRRDLDAVLALVDEEVTLLAIAAYVDGGYHGHDGVRQWWENMFEAFPDYTIDVGEVRDLGNATLAALRILGHGSGSGAPFEQLLFQIVDWRRAKAIRLESFRSEAEALDALGLSE